MGRRCLTCAHPQHEKIDLELLDSVSYRSVGAKYGISPVSIRRHFEAGHIAKELVVASQTRKIAYSNDVLDKLMFLQHEALKVLDQAKNPQDGKPLLSVALGAIGRVGALLETQARLAGQLREQEVSLAINPTFVAIKARIFDALRDLPEAHRALTPILTTSNEEKPFKPITDDVRAIIDSRYRTDVTPGVQEIIDRIMAPSPGEDVVEDRKPAALDQAAPQKPSRPAGLQATRRRQ